MAEKKSGDTVVEKEIAGLIETDGSLLLGSLLCHLWGSQAQGDPKLGALRCKAQRLKAQSLKG